MSNLHRIMSQTRRAQYSAYLPHRPWLLTFQNLITSSPVAKGMTDDVWWQSDSGNSTHTHIHADRDENNLHHLRWGR